MFPISFDSRETFMLTFSSCCCWKGLFRFLERELIANPAAETVAAADAASGSSVVTTSLFPPHP